MRGAGTAHSSASDLTCDRCAAHACLHRGREEWIHSGREGEKERNRESARKRNTHTHTEGKGGREEKERDAYLEHPLGSEAE